MGPNAQFSTGVQYIRQCIAGRGYTGKDGDIPTACPAGTYKQACDYPERVVKHGVVQDELVVVPCTRCEAGKFKGDTAQTSDTCTDCEANSRTAKPTAELFL